MWTNCPKTMAAHSRREFLTRSALGFGALAGNVMANPYARRSQHFAAKGKSVIFLFMHGGPSHLDTFDPKPELNRLHGQPIPKSFGKVDFQFSNMERTPLMGSPRRFRKRGQSGVEISDLFEHTAAHADELAVIRSCHHDGFTHVTGQTWMNTGWSRVGRPSVGSWVVYGLGNESDNLPSYVVMLDGGIKAGAPAYGSGFLPAAYQGTVLRSEGPPILNIKRPEGISGKEQETMLAVLREMNETHRAPRAEDTELAARMASYELAFKMQMSVPEVTDLGAESEATRKLYGMDEEITAEFGRECLLARRLVEKGVRFVELLTPARPGLDRWDQHSGIENGHRINARSVDKPIAGLLRDLKGRGLLKDTLVIWGGEFGRTPCAQIPDNGDRSRVGRDHNPYGFTMWMAGGGVKGGMVYGATDEYGYFAVENKVHVHDLHATMLHLLGLDHKRLTYRYSGRDMRLTDVHGNVVKEILG